MYSFIKILKARVNVIKRVKLERLLPLANILSRVYYLRVAQGLAVLNV
jgi:hypothetical protein